VLLRRRQVWLPTVWGWLLLFGAFAALGSVFVFTVAGFLSPNAPAHGSDGSGARTLVVEGWIDPDEIPQAVDAFRRGHYERLLTTGGPIDPWADAGGWHTFAARAAAYLRREGLAGASIFEVPAPDTGRDRTYLSAVMVREWAKRASVGFDSIDIFTAGVHARRSWMLYRSALGSGVEVGVMAAKPSGFDAVHWWTSSTGTKSTMGEFLSVVWTGCCFWPPASEFAAEAAAADVSAASNVAATNPAKSNPAKSTPAFLAPAPPTK
jgi:DUF218 domain